MYEDGITSGCGDGKYCPENTTTRAQTAVFIIRALYGGTFSYSSEPHFNDVPDTHWAFKYIQKMYEDGITTYGCGDGNYCPSSATFRALKASYIARSPFEIWKRKE